MKNTSNISLLIFGLLLMLYALPTQAQFNEKLEKEILEIGKKHQLDDIEKFSALDQLEEICPPIEKETIKSGLIGKSWQYSHSVDSKGRKYRRSNAVYKYDFSANGDSFLLSKKDGAKTWCTWTVENSKMLELDYFESSERENRTRRDFLGIHSISSDRLVLTKVIRSKTFEGKSAILFNVYFRK